MAIRQAYEKARIAHNLVADAAQERIVDRLGALQDEILAYEAATSAWRRWLPAARKTPHPRGIYLWGGVGRGKTFLMDLFFSSLAIKRKRRIHFHRMMHDVHARLKTISGTEDPLNEVAASIAAETSVLCFDEFFVSDIADAMILGRLLDGLFGRRVILVATSNARPADLYRNGLQRRRFLPAIDALEKFTEVIELDHGIDYRLRLFEQAGTYLTPADESAEAKLAHYFAEIASAGAESDRSIEILGREIQTRHCAKGIVWFDFQDICDGPRSQEDYIEISRWYPTVIISNIPRLTTRLDNPARRFVALVDEFYERKVKLVVSAAVPANALYEGKLLEFEFQRTVSRLIEMQSADYLHAEHLA